MPVSLAVRGRHAGDTRGEAAWQEALTILRHVDHVFSAYRHHSVISRLGRGELRPENCPPEVVEVLQLGELARQQSGGAFDIRRRGPDSDFHLLDPSGVVKGWAVDRAARAFEGLPETDFCLSAGGDMVCRSKLESEPAWRIGIEDPHQPARILAVVPIRNGAVATSGLTHRGAHIVDARSGQTPLELASVTVIGPDLTWADIDATAAFALGAHAVQWLQTRQGRRGLVVWADGTLEVFGPEANIEGGPSSQDFLELSRTEEQAVVPRGSVRGGVRRS
jgi:thiamine biosynthesis lipoprotein